MVRFLLDFCNYLYHKNPELPESLRAAWQIPLKPQPSHVHTSPKAFYPALFEGADCYYTVNSRDPLSARLKFKEFVL